MKEFNLSEKFHFGDDRTIDESGDRYYIEKDVKEFIKQIKEGTHFESHNDQDEWEEMINKLAGENFK
jgi:hypothetical protein